VELNKESIMAEYTSKKMVELAEEVVGSMDQEQLVELAYYYILEGYEANEEVFYEDWHTYYGLDEEDTKPDTNEHPDLRLFRRESGYEDD